MVLTGTDAQTVRPYKGLHVASVVSKAMASWLLLVTLYYNGRTDRASLQGVVSSDRLRLSTMSVRSDLGVLIARHYLVPLPAVDVSPQARLRY